MEAIELQGGARMPLLGLGTFKVTDPGECSRSVLAAIRAGYRLIDTAQAYGNEAAVGAGIRAAIGEGLCGRADLFVTTKVNFRSFETEDCRRSLAESRSRLGLDYLDMVLLHWPFGNVYAAWRVLEEEKDAGRIRAIGVSNMEPDRFIDLCEFNRVRPDVNQIETHLYCQRRGVREWMGKYGIACQAYAPLGQGRANEMFSEEAVAGIAARHSKTPAQVLLRFLTQEGISAIPKSVHEARIVENIGIFDFELDGAEMEALRALDRDAPMIGLPEKPEKVVRAMGW
ncbi:MAG: aldo/keto reductase [Kiritimatiellae bacterium]|nr:aldo/keto reductase [Kiritimatiellia bacterium]